MSPSSRFWDRIARRYAAKPVPNEAVYQRKLEKTRALFDAEATVLELGCGTGSTAIAHAQFVKHIRGVDISANMLAIAKSKAAELGIDNVAFEQASVESFEPAGPVDAVLCMSVLHLLEDWPGALKKIHGWVKPGGYLVSSTACIADRMAFLRWVLPVMRWVGLVPFVRVFTEAELLDGMRDAGFDIVETWRPDNGMAVFVIAQRAATRQNAAMERSVR